MSIVLIGYRGSGKTTIGRLLAERLGYAFVDSDEEIVKESGKTIKQLFAEDGEATFRDLESIVVAKLASRPDRVISLGGGAVMRHENRADIAASAADVVYLRADPQTLYNRIHADPATEQNRPHLTAHAGGIEEIRQLLKAREPGYLEIASIVVDVSARTPDQAVEQILAEMI